MKKSLMELTTEEFVRLICDMPEIYTLERKIWNKDGTREESDTIVGNYECLHDCFWIDSDLKDYVENNLFDYDVAFSDIDIYNYLDEKTKGFDVPRVRILLNEIERIHLLTIDEERLSIIQNKIENGWKDYKIIEKSVFGKVSNVIDYKDAYNTVFGIGYDIFYYDVLNILKKKLPQHKQLEPQPEQTTKLPPELQTERAVKYFAKAVEMGFIENTQTGYKSKFQSKALLAYFLELVFCRDDEGQDNGVKFPETALNRLFNESRLGKARGQIANNKKDKPDGAKAVENILK